jgi:peptide/nickel transport system substrate-binding protein
VCGAVVAAVGLCALWLLIGSMSVARSASAEMTVLRATYASFPDYLDPQLSYTNEGWNAMYETYIPLLTFRHATGKAGSEVTPGLARSMPRVSDSGRKYVLYLREGLKYSNGRPVRASDFKYTVKRMRRLYSSGSPFFATIKRIVTDDESGRIAITLTHSRGTFTYELALPFVALVPAGTPMRDLSGDPPLATGPYEIASSEPGVGWAYKRNPQWAANNQALLPQLPSGQVDRIEVTVIRNSAAQVKALEDGKIDWIQNPPPPSLTGPIKRKFGGTQFRLEPTHSIYYFWMNTTKPPFDDLRVRRAVNYAVDAGVLSRGVYGGQLAPTQQIVPPGMLGYRKFELYPHSMRKARRLIGKAKSRDHEITVWTDNESPNFEAGDYYARVLRRLGFRVHLKVVNADSYFTVIGNASTPDLDTGWSDWFEDYPHPNDFFQPLLAGSSIFPTYNSNFARLSVPSLNRRMAQLRERPMVPQAGYAALDRSYMKLAPMAPYGTRLLSTFVSKRVDLDQVVWSDTFGADLASFRFR